MGNTVSSPSGQQSPLYDRQTFPRSEKKLVPKANTLGRSDNLSQSNGNQESSRMLFLMYLINRTWNVVTDGKGGKRWVALFSLLHAAAPKKAAKKRNRKRGSAKIVWHGFHFPFNLISLDVYCSFSLFQPSHLVSFSSFSFTKKNSPSDDDTGKPRFLHGEGKGNDDNYSCAYGSECSYCSCGYCDDESCRINGNYSICERWVWSSVTNFLHFKSLKAFTAKKLHRESNRKAFRFFLFIWFSPLLVASICWEAKKSSL